MVDTFPTMKAHESVGRREKLAVRPPKFATHKRHMVCKRNGHSNMASKSFGLKNITFAFKMIIGCESSMTDLSRMDIGACGRSR